MVIFQFGFAQKQAIKGTVLDATNQTPIPYATIVLLNDSTIVDGAISDEQGAFSIRKPASDFNTVEIRFIGYQTYTISKASIDALDNIRVLLTPAIENLQDVTVTGERTLTLQKIDRKVINLGSDLQQAGTSALEALDQISEIQTDLGSGSISLRGSGDVRLLINGKPSGMSATELLQQIPSSSIDRFEIITSPSAKEQANGIGGIVNVILKKDLTKGLNATIKSGYGTIKYNYGINGNFNKDWFNLRFNWNEVHEDRVSDQTLNRVYSDNRTERIYTPNQYKGNVNRFRTGIDIFPDKHNEFSIDWEHTDDYHKFNNPATYTRSTESSDFVHLRNSEHFHIINTVNGNFLHRFAGKNHTLEVDYNLNTIDNTFPNQDLRDDIFLSEEEYKLNNSLQFIGIDYALPVNKAGVFEAGIHWNKRKLKSSYAFTNIQTETFDRFNYEENVIAGYALVRWDFDKLKVQSGLRYEYFESTSESSRAPLSTAKTFSNLFPSIHLSYQLSDNQQLSFGYSKRIARPNFTHVNPFQLGNQYFRLEGNPDLQAETADNIELNYQYHGSNFDLSLSSFYRSRKDVLQMLFNFDSEGVQIANYINGSINNSSGIEGTFGYEATSFWNLSLSANYYYTTVDNEAFTWNELYSSTIQFKNTFKVAKPLTMDLSYRLDLKRQQVFRYFEPRNRLDFALRGSFYSNRLSVSLRVIDVLNNNLQERTTVTPQIVQETTWRFATQSRSFLLSASFSLFENVTLKRTRRKRDYQHGGAID